MAKTRIWIAVSVYVIVTIIRKRLNIEESLHTILQILNFARLDKVQLNQLLNKATPQISQDRPSNRLNLFDH